MVSGLFVSLSLKEDKGLKRFVSQASYAVLDSPGRACSGELCSVRFSGASLGRWYFVSLLLKEDKGLKRVVSEASLGRC